MLLEKIIAAHGGIEKWKRVHRLRMNVQIGGNVLMSKLCSPFRQEYRVEIDPHRPYSVIEPFFRKDCRGIFDGFAVEIRNREGIVKKKQMPRTTNRVVKKKLIWDELDLLYFLGYALWNYTVTPFVFAEPGFSVIELPPIIRRKQQINRLQVTYPEYIPTHCPTQVFYFNEKNLQVQLDYYPHVLFSWPKAMHFCHEHDTIDGFVFPTRRVARPSFFGYAFPWFGGMSGGIDSIDVIYK